jgi:hypothetical protein
VTACRLRVLVGVLAGVLAACSGTGASPLSSTLAASTLPATTASTSAPTSSTSLTASSTTVLSTIAPATTTTVAPRISGAVDLVAYQAASGGDWFGALLEDLPETDVPAEGVFEVLAAPVENRRDGEISPLLVSSYVFVQFGEIGSDDLEEHAATLRGLFIRSALLSFVDYAGDRVLDWDWFSAGIPMDVIGMIRKANELGLPVSLEINYSDFVPGPVGSGLDALVEADNIAGTISFLETLEAEGLRVDCVTFGDEIGDDAGFGRAKPTLDNSNLVARFVAYAVALKSRFPNLKIYAFDSYIAATRGEVADYFPLLREIREAEVREGVDLIDGFVFRESYVYMDAEGRVLDSQSILDDVESLAGSGPVLRYDVFGNRHPGADRGYLVTLADDTREIFGRDLDIGITEYLPTPRPTRTSTSSSTTPTSSAPTRNRDWTWCPPGCSPTGPTRRSATSTSRGTGGSTTPSTSSWLSISRVSSCRSKGPSPTRPCASRSMSPRTPMGTSSCS